MDINELCLTVSVELRRLEGAESENEQVAALRNIQIAMDEFKAHQTHNELKSLREFLERDGVSITDLSEDGDQNSAGIEIALRQPAPMRLFFDNVSTVMLAGSVLLEDGLSPSEDTD
ncbi:MAG: hypothetical protein AAF674_16635 [Pseudomonadota bacterium]